MRRHRRWRARAVSVAIVATACSGGVALGAVSAAPPPPQPVTVAGTLTYLWHGDAARGCARENLCDVTGSLSVRFENPGFELLASRRGADVFSPATGTVRVVQAGPGTAPAECVELISIEDLTVAFRPGANGGYTATFRPTEASSGRCAGPLDRDLASISLPASRSKGPRGASFDVRGSVPFPAGPFSGALVSQLTVSPQTPQSGGGSSSSSSSGSFFGGPGSKSHTALVEYASARYRITGATGELLTGFTGDPEPLCEPLDACGVTGSVTLTVTGYRNTFTISASRIVRRPASRRRALADLRAGRLTLDGDTLISRAPALIAEAFTRDGAAACQDSNVLPVSLESLPAPGLRSTIPLLLGGAFPGPGEASDPIRSYCPGPTGADAGAVARGTIALRDVGRPRISVALARPGSFAGPGYSGTRSGTLHFSLTLLALRAGTRREPMP